MKRLSHLGYKSLKTPAQFFIRIFGVLTFDHSYCALQISKRQSSTIAPMAKSSRKTHAKKSMKKAENKTPSPNTSQAMDKKKRRKSRKQSYKMYIYKVLKSTSSQVGISSKAMAIMENFVYDTFERLAKESGQLAGINKRSTISSREVQTAARLLLPGELSKHAVSEATKALDKYTDSKG